MKLFVGNLDLQATSAELETLFSRFGTVATATVLHNFKTGEGHGFGYVEIEDEARWAAIASTPECRRWWKHMREIMPFNPDDSPVSEELREVFHLE